MSQKRSDFVGYWRKPIRCGLVIERWVFAFPEPFDLWIRDADQHFCPKGLVIDNAFCDRFVQMVSLTGRRADDCPNHAVRERNDLFRKTGFEGGTLLVTAALKAKGSEFVRRALEAVRSFDDFTEDNDPWGEHDFGALRIDDQKVFWKIDCFDPTLSHHSENPANAALTHRVLTLMLAEEY